MSTKEKTSGYRELLTGINKGVFAPVYVLHGDEDYYIDSLVAALEEKVVSPEERDFDVVTFYGSDAEMSNVIAAAQRYPVIGPKQLVMLKESQSMHLAKSELEKLSSYVVKPNPSTVLVVTFKGDPLPSTHSLIKQLKNSQGVAFKSDRIKDYNLSAPIKDYCAAKRINIDEKATALLIEYVGGPLSKIFSEIDRVIIAEGGRIEKITAAHIEKNIGISKDYNNYELVKALSRKDYGKSMRIIKYFASNPKQSPTPVISATLFNFFSKLFLATLIKNKTTKALLDELDLKSSFQLKDYEDGLRNYNVSSAMAAIHFIREFDAKSKGIGSFQKEHELLRELIFKIISYR